MRFNIPEQGETSTMTRFAFLPIRIDNKIVWLEKYKETHIYFNGRWRLFYKTLL